MRCRKASQEAKIVHTNSERKNGVGHLSSEYGLQRDGEILEAMKNEIEQIRNTKEVKSVSLTSFGPS